jgi:hypothetical protein
LPHLVLTVDTEPDLPKRRQMVHSGLRNIPELRTLQLRIPDVKLTLLVTQSVLNDAPSLREIEHLKRDFDCEVGAHLTLLDLRGLDPHFDRSSAMPPHVRPGFSNSSDQRS